ncbi:MAG TPA: serine hydrolase domain-containing protein [Aquamicrobium sp.]|nr:serine hydrolase domain-containing protein [Aquamicrobium sp.]
MSRPDWPSVMEWCRTEQEAGRLEAGQLLVVRAGETCLDHCFGRRGDGAEVDGGTIFWLASMTKPVTCAAALALVEAGLFSLRTPVRQVLPEFDGARMADGRAVGDGLTVLDLMRHTAGLGPGNPEEKSLHDCYLERRVYDFASTNAVMARRLAALPLADWPGTVFSYGLAIDLLGRVMEVAAGAPLGRILRERVLAPLGMDDTAFRPDRARLAGAGPLRVLAGLAPSGTESDTWESGGGGLWSTARDYGRFAAMLMAGGSHDGRSVLAPHLARAMVEPHLPVGVGFAPGTDDLASTAPGEATGLGFGLGVAVRVRDMRDPAGFRGEFMWPGVSGAQFWVDPANELTVVFLTHAPLHRREHRLSLRRAVHRDLGLS